MLITKCIDLGVRRFKSNKVKIPYKIEERNQPALDWIRMLNPNLNKNNLEILEFRSMEHHLKLKKYFFQKINYSDE